MLPLDKTVKTPILSTYLSEASLDLKSDHTENKHSESIAKAIQVPNRSHQIQTCNQYQYTSLQIERIILKLVELTMWT
jgi:hypothetical protein